MKKYTLTDDTLRKAWLNYNLKIDKIIENAKYKKGEDISWQFQDRIETYEEFKLEYKTIRTQNRYARIKGWKVNTNITDRLVKQARTWKPKTIKTYKEKMGLTTVKDAEKKLKSMTRQELFDALLDISDGDYYAASAEYQTIVNGHIAKTGSTPDYIIQNAG